MLPRMLASGLVALLVLACAAGEDRLEEARELQDQERYAESAAILRQILDEDPSRTEASFLLGVALMRTGEGGLAIWPLRKAAKSPEYAVEAGLLLAQAMLEGRTAPDAIRALDQVLEREPDHVQALALRVQAYLAVGRLDEALLGIDRVLELDPENIAILVPRVSALIATRQIEKAGEALQQARERFDTTEEVVAPEMRARLCIAQGMFSFEKGDREAAETQYAECVEAFPTLRVAVGEAVAFYDRIDQPERATGILERASRESDDPFFRIALARRLGAMGDLDEEERIFREEVEAQDTPMAWFGLADLYVQREEYDRALASFEKAIQLSPEPSPSLRFAYADTLVQAGRYAEARRQLETIEQPELRELVRGRILLAEGDPQGALEAFGEGIRLWPNNAAGRFLAGQAAEQLGDFERALSEYRESVRADPAKTRAGLVLAQLHQLRAEYAAALEALGRHLRSHPRDPEGYFAGIRIAHRAGRHDIAAEGLRRLARLPAQAAAAVAEEAALVELGKGAREAVGTIEGSELDLTDPAHAVALDKLLALLASLAEHDRAEALWRRAVEAHPDEAEFHALRGRALRAAGKPEAVRHAFERALELDAENPQALTGLAELAAEAGDAEAALALYDRLAAADPDDPAPARAAAQLLLEAGETGEAERRLQRLLERHPREGAAALALAELAAARGERERALSLAERAAWLRTPGADAALGQIRGPGMAEPTEPDVGSLVPELGRRVDAREP